MAQVGPHYGKEDVMLLHKAPCAVFEVFLVHISPWPDNRRQVFGCAQGCFEQQQLSGPQFIIPACNVGSIFQKLSNN